MAPRWNELHGSLYGIYIFSSFSVIAYNAYTSPRLIVVACLVEFGEVLARLIVDAALPNKRETILNPLPTLTREQAILALENIINNS